MSVQALGGNGEVNPTAFRVGEASSPPDLQRIAKSLKKPGLSSKEKRKLKNTIKSLAPEDVKGLLNIYFKDIWCEIDPKDPLKHAERLAEFIPFEKLGQAAGQAYKTPEEALQSVKTMRDTANHYLKHVEKDASTLHVRAKISAFLDASVIALENTITALGIADFFEPPENEFHASFKFQKLMMLISIFTLLTSVLIPLLGPQTGTYVVAGALGSLAILSLIYPKIRPKSSFLPEGENWTKKFREGKLGASDVRKEAVAQIYQALISSNGEVKSHPLLIGKTGVGKTETVKAFVRSLEEGKFRELKGKTVFYFNTADLVNSKGMFGGGNKILKQISDEMGRHREDIILVFDEIHLACHKKYSVIGEQLKTLLDGKFPFVIGLTTEEEFAQHIYLSNAAFARRFTQINIENTDRKQTLSILSNYYLKYCPQIILENGCLNTVLDKTQETQQPLSSVKLLAQCVKKVSENQLSNLEKRIEQVSSEILAANSQAAVEAFSFEEASLEEEEPNLANLEKTLEELQEELKGREQKMKQLHTAQKSLLAVKKMSFETVLKTQKFGKRLSSSQKKELERFLFLTFFVRPSLEAKIKETSKELGVRSVIDKGLVEEILQEEATNLKKAQEQMQQGRKRAEERKILLETDSAQSEESSTL